jgi:cytochrome c-type biogenesis protein CcmH
VADRLSRRGVWVRMALPLVVLAVALVIGSGAFSGKPQTPAQRAAAIESVVRCPSCTDVSVAQSEESTALSVRHEIERQVARGRSTAQIEQTLVSQYGQTILLEPPDSGGFAVVWIVPIVVGAGALAGVAVLFWRRSRQFAASREAQMAADAP